MELQTKTITNYTFLMVLTNFIVQVIVSGFRFYNAWHGMKNEESDQVETEFITEKDTLKLGTIQNHSDMAKNTWDEAEKVHNILIDIILSTFVIAWTPYSVVVIIETNEYYKIPVILYQLVSILAKTTCFFIPFIYGLVYDDISTLPAELWIKDNKPMYHIIKRRACSFQLFQNNTLIEHNKTE